MTEATKQITLSSADGTDIAVHVTGSGPPLVISHGSVASGRDWQPVADALATRMTTYAVDRRGRGASGDHEPYDIQREQEDIAAVLKVAGPEATLFGHSFGALVALAVALEKAPAQLIVYEPPLPLNGPVGGEALAVCAQAIADGDPERALITGLRQIVGAPDEGIETFRKDAEFWSERVSLAASWIRELTATDAYDGTLDRFAGLGIPTLVIKGSVSPPWLADAATRLHGVVPGAELVEIPGQAHDAHVYEPGTVAEVIADFALS